MNDIYFSFLTSKMLMQFSLRCRWLFIILCKWICQNVCHPMGVLPLKHSTQGGLSSHLLFLVHPSLSFLSLSHQNGKKACQEKVCQRRRRKKTICRSWLLHYIAKPLCDGAGSPQWCAFDIFLMSYHGDWGGPYFWSSMQWLAKYLHMSARQTSERRIFWIGSVE